MKNKILKNYAFVVAFSLLFGSIYIQPSSISLALQGKLSLDKKEISLHLEEAQTSKHEIKITNLSNEDIFYSAYKIANESRPYQIKQNSLNAADPGDELGSGWYTTQQNFGRTGFNPVESSVPPYAYKWQHQADKVLFSPVISGRNLYIPSENGNVYWIDSRTGVNKSLFSISTNLTTINLHKKYLILTSSSELFVYDRVQMTILWKMPCSMSNAYSISAEDETLFYTNGNSVVSCNIASGNPKWFIEGGFKRISLTNSQIIAVSGMDTITSLDKESGKTNWQVKFENRVIGSPLCYDDKIFVTSNSLLDNKTEIQCLDQDGKNIWTYKIDSLAIAPVSANEVSIYLALNNGNVNCIDKATGILNWKQDLKAPIHVPVVLTYGLAFIGTNDSKIIALDNKNGEYKWEVKTKFPVESPLVIAQGFIYAADNVGTLLAYGRDWENVVPPMPPDRLKAFPGNNMVTLSWRALMLEQDLAGYHIYRKTLYEKDFSFITSLPFVNNYQDRSLKNNSTYHYTIRAFDTYGNESTTSNMASVTPSEKADPPWLTFEPTSGLIQSNKDLQMQINVNTFDLVPGLYSGSIFIAHSGDMEEEEPISIKVNLEVKRRISDKPRAPIFSKVVPSDTRVTLTWIPDNTFQTYMLYRSTVSKDEYHLLTTLTSASTNYQDDTVKNGQKYFYALKGIDKQSKETDFSDEAVVIPKPLPIEVNMQNNSQVSVPVLKISGHVDPKAKFSVNQIQIPISQDGFYETMIGVTVGDNSIPLVATDTGNEKQEFRLKLNFKCSELQILLKINSNLVEVNSFKWPYLLEAPPSIVEARTYVPVRFISEIVGATVKWDSREKKITITKGDINIELWLDRKTVRVNGKETIIDAAPFVSNGRTLVPLRFIVEPLGANVVWNKQEQSILLTFKF